MKREYFEPNAEILILSTSDIMTASEGGDGNKTGDDYENWTLGDLSKL